MSYNVEQALKDGVPEEEIARYLSSTRNFKLEDASKEGYSYKEIIDYLSPHKPISQKPIVPEVPAEPPTPGVWPAIKEAGKMALEAPVDIAMGIAGKAADVVESAFPKKPRADIPTPPPVEPMVAKPTFLPPGYVNPSIREQGERMRERMIPTTSPVATTPPIPTPIVQPISMMAEGERANQIRLAEQAKVNAPTIGMPTRTPERRALEPLMQTLGLNKEGEVSPIERAKASNLVALSKATGDKVSPSQIEPIYEQLMEHIGLKQNPTSGEFLPMIGLAAATLMSGGGTSLALGAAKTALGLGGFMGIQEAKSLGTQVLAGEKPKLFQGRGPTEFLGPLKEPYATATEAAEIILPPLIAGRLAWGVRDWFRKQPSVKQGEVIKLLEDKMNRGQKPAEIAREWKDPDVIEAQWKDIKGEGIKLGEPLKPLPTPPRLQEQEVVGSGIPIVSPPVSAKPIEQTPITPPGVPISAAPARPVYREGPTPTTPLSPLPVQPMVQPTQVAEVPPVIQQAPPMMGVRPEIPPTVEPVQPTPIPQMMGIGQQLPAEMPPPVEPTLPTFEEALAESEQKAEKIRKATQEVMGLRPTEPVPQEVPVEEGKTEADIPMRKGNWVLHENTIPGEGPWRITELLPEDEYWKGKGLAGTPATHRDFPSYRDAYEWMKMHGNEKMEPISKAPPAPQEASVEEPKTVPLRSVSWDELTDAQKKWAENKYVQDTGDEARFAKESDWWINTETGEIGNKAQLTPKVDVGQPVQALPPTEATKPEVLQPVEEGEVRAAPPPESVMPLPEMPIYSLDNPPKLNEKVIWRDREGIVDSAPSYAQGTIRILDPIQGRTTVNISELKLVPQPETVRPIKEILSDAYNQGFEEMDSQKLPSQQDVEGEIGRKLTDREWTAYQNQFNRGYQVALESYGEGLSEKEQKAAPPRAETVTAPSEVESTSLSSDEAQKAVDAKIDELTEQGKSWEDIFKNPEVIALRKMRDEIEQNYVPEWKEVVIKETGLPREEVKKVLSKLLPPGKTEGGRIAGKTLKEWGLGTEANLSRLYNHFTEGKENRTQAIFAWDDTTDGPRLQGALIGGSEFGWDKEALKKTEKIYNAIAKNEGGEPIDLSRIGEKSALPHKVSKEALFIGEEVAGVGKEVPVYGRYLYRTPGEKGWMVMGGNPALNPVYGHYNLVSEWNKKDIGKREWKWEEVQKGDFDYPKEEATPFQVDDKLTLHSPHTDEDTIVNYRGPGESGKAVVWTGKMQIQVPMEWLSRGEGKLEESPAPPKPVPEVAKEGEKGGVGRVEGQEKPTISQESAKYFLSLPHEQRAYPYGDQNAAFRQRVLKELTGESLPKNKAGAGKVRDALAKAAGIDTEGKAGVEIEQGIHEWLKGIASVEKVPVKSIEPSPLPQGFQPVAQEPVKEVAKAMPLEEAKPDIESLYDQHQTILQSLPNNIGKAKQEGKLSKKQLANLETIDRIEKEVEPYRTEWDAIHKRRYEESIKKQDEWMAEQQGKANKKLADAGFSVGDKVEMVAPSFLPTAPSRKYYGTVGISKNGSVYVRTTNGEHLDLFKNPWSKIEKAIEGKEILPPGTVVKTVTTRTKPTKFTNPVSWVISMGGVRSNDPNIDAKGWGPKESGYVGLISKNARYSLDELATLLPEIGFPPMTTDELSAAITNHIMGGRKGPVITEKYLLEAEREHAETLMKADPDLAKPETRNALTSILDNEIMGMKEEWREQGHSEQEIQAFTDEAYKAAESEEGHRSPEQIRETITEPTKEVTQNLTKQFQGTLTVYRSGEIGQKSRTTGTPKVWEFGTPGDYFGGSEEVASIYGKPVKLSVDIKNPFVIVASEEGEITPGYTNTDLANVTLEDGTKMPLDNIGDYARNKGHDFIVMVTPEAISEGTPVENATLFRIRKDIKPSGLSPDATYFNTSHDRFEGYAWRSMSPKEYESLMAGEKTYGGEEAKRGQYLAPTPESAGQYKATDRILVEFGGVEGAEGETISNLVGKENVTQVWALKGDKWEKKGAGAKPSISPTKKGEQLLPGMKVGLEMSKEGIKVEPTLEGSPLMQAARKAEVDKVQPSLFKAKPSPESQVGEVAAKVEPPVAEGKEGKKPWEMNVEQFSKWFREQPIDYQNRRQIQATGQGGVKIKGPHLKPMEEISVVHKGEIQQALTSGDLTPSEAIRLHKADYPDIEGWEEMRGEKDPWNMSQKERGGAGYIGPLWHGTDKEFIGFKPGYDKPGRETPNGFSFAPSEKLAKQFGENTREVYVKLSNPRIETNYEDSTRWKGAVGRKDLEQMGYDGAILINDMGFQEVIAFHPEQIKIKPTNIGETEKADAALSKNLGKEIPKESGEPSPTVARPDVSAKLRQSAESLTKQIQEKRNPAVAQQNVTSRRARQTSSAYEEADRLENLQNKLNALADAHETGTVPESLRGLTTKSQVETVLIRAFPSAHLHKQWIQDILNVTKDKPGTAEDRAILSRVMMRGEYGGNLSGQTEISATENLIKIAEKVGERSPWIKESIAEHKRMLSAGIDTEEKFKRANADLNELGKKPIDRSKEQKIRTAEQNLLGRKIPGYFPTPKVTAEHLVEMADIKPGMSVLEPSAGKGNIADAIRENVPDANLKTIEWQGDLSDILRLKGHEVIGSDFLEHKEQYDRIVMNPPFENLQDIDHVRHAYDLLKPGGKLVSIMSESPFFRSDKKAVAFREWLDSVGGTNEKLPEKSFAQKSERATGVSGRIVVIDKPKEKTKGEGGKMLYGIAPLILPFLAGLKESEDRKKSPLPYLKNGKIYNQGSPLPPGMGR